MRLFIYFISLFILLSVISCSTDEHRNNASISYDSQSSEVAIEDALKNLENTIKAISTNTKSPFSNKTISNITTLTMDDFVMTKSSDQNDFNKLLYIVNFEEGGSAVLGADTRIHPILLITEETNITKADFTSSIAAPPTLTQSALYCEEDQEYYIGNTSTTLPHSTFVVNYLQNAITSSTTQNNEYVYSFSVNDFSVSLVKTKWHQDDPYNGKIRKSTFGGKRRPAGCTTIALAQMLVYNKDISISKFGVTTSTWNDMDKASISRLVTSNESEQLKNDILINDVSTLIKSIADGINVKYNFLLTGGTFATPQQVMKYMRSIGYANADKIDKFSLSTIKNTVKAGKPIFIAALSPELVGHAWIIDGYVTQIATHVDTGVQEEQLLLHCNWGWGGTDDGYYIPELFDNPQWLDDAGNISSGNEQGFNASWWYRLITY